MTGAALGVTIQYSMYYPYGHI